MSKPYLVVSISIWSALVTIVSAQPPAETQRARVVMPDQLGVGANPRKVTFLELLKLPAIGVELKLTDADRKRLQDAEKKVEEHKNRWSQEVRTRMKQLADDGDKEALEAAREAFLDEWGVFLDGAETARSKALSPAQAARLNQIRLQAEGPLAFDRPEVLGRLNLSPEQVELLQTLVAEGRRRLENVSKVQIGSVGPGESPRQVRGSPELYKSEQFKAWKQSSLDATLAARDETMQAIAKVLTKGQRATFRKMIGEPFDLAKLRDNVPAPPADEAKRDKPREESAK